MPEPMTPEQLAAIRARADMATRGPWQVNARVLPLSEHGRQFWANSQYPQLDTYERFVETAWIHPQGHARLSIWCMAHSVDTDPREHWHMEADDAEFIAHARTDVPALIAEVERLRAQLVAMERRAEREEAV